MIKTVREWAGISHDRKTLRSSSHRKEPGLRPARYRPHPVATTLPWIQAGLLAYLRRSTHLPTPSTTQWLSGTSQDHSSGGYAGIMQGVARIHRTSRFTSGRDKRAQGHLYQGTQYKPFARILVTFIRNFPLYPEKDLIQLAHSGSEIMTSDHLGRTR